MSESFIYLSWSWEEKEGSRETGNNVLTKPGIKNLSPVPNGVLHVYLNYRPQIPPGRNIHDNSTLERSKEN